MRQSKRGSAGLCTIRCCCRGQVMKDLVGVGAMSKVTMHGLPGAVIHQFECCSWCQGCLGRGLVAHHKAKGCMLQSQLVTVQQQARLKIAGVTIRRLSVPFCI